MTERKRSEEALREAEARLALEAARMGEWSLDLATGEATHSALYDRIFGYEEPLSAWTFETFLGHVHPDDRAFVTEAFGRSRQTGEDWAFECRIERARAEAALQASEERLRLTVESVTDYAISTLDPEWRITSWNSGAESIFGYPEEEVLGQSGDILFTPEDREAGVPEEEARTAGEEGRASDERWHVRKDGGRFYVSGIYDKLDVHSRAEAIIWARERGIVGG